MNKYKIILFTFVYHAVITQVSRSLGFTTDVITRSSAPDVGGDIGLLEALWKVITIVINNMGSFIQLITLQADIPYIFAIFLIYPTSLLMLFVIIELIRG